MSSDRSEDPKQLAKLIQQGQRRALGKALSYAESSLPEQQQLAQQIIAALGQPKSPYLRLGISGPPGVGKSTFVEALGQKLLAREPKIAVFSVDPSSPIHGGSLLGDKTRMPVLASDPRAFIRPSPSGGALGGVSWRTRESLDLLAAAGYPFVILETVGVGQSEVLASSLVDVFICLFNPNTGDELQALKKGIMEVVDLAVVTKADGTTEAAAKQAASVLESSWHLLSIHGHEAPPVFACSSLTGAGIDAIVDQIYTFRDDPKIFATILKRRDEQLAQSIKEQVLQQLRRQFDTDAKLGQRVAELGFQVAQKSQSLAEATTLLISEFFRK